MRRYTSMGFAGAMVAAAGLHAYWALGGTWFVETAFNMDIERVPERLVPATWGLALVAILAAIAALARGEWFPGRRPVIPMWMLAAVFWVVAMVCAGAAIYDATIPRAWDRYVFAPVFVALTAMAVRLAWPIRERA